MLNFQHRHLPLRHCKIQLPQEFKPTDHQRRTFVNCFLKHDRCCTEAEQNLQDTNQRGFTVSEGNYKPMVEYFL